MDIFAGGARLLLASASAHGEVLNNVNGDLANLYRVEPITSGRSSLPKRAQRNLQVTAFSDVPYGYLQNLLDSLNKNRYHLIKF